MRIIHTFVTYDIFNGGLFVVDLLKHKTQLDSRFLKGNLSGLHALLVQMLCGLFVWPFCITKRVL